MYINWVKRDMKRVFKRHKKFLDTIVFNADLTTNASRYIPASGEIVVSEKQVEVSALSRNYSRQEVDGEVVRATDVEVTLLLDDLKKNNVTPSLNDEVWYKDATWTIQGITKDQLQTLLIVQLRSTNG